MQGWCTGPAGRLLQMAHGSYAAAVCTLLHTRQARMPAALHQMRTPCAPVVPSQCFMLVRVLQGALQAAATHQPQHQHEQGALGGRRREVAGSGKRLSWQAVLCCSGPKESP